MKLFKICIKRPVLATVLNLIIILIGTVAYTRLSICEYPNIDAPIVSVETNFEGADPALIESQITLPLEESLSSIAGINYMVSHSRPEYSEITIHFLLNIEPSTAIADVRDRISRVKDKLPKNIHEPIISKVEANAEPIIWLAFSSNKYSSLELSDIAEHSVKDRIQTIPGIAQVIIFGERRYSMRIWLNPKRLAAYQITPIDIENALKSQNIELPAGRIEANSREFTILSATDLNHIKQFEDIIIKNVNGYLIRIKDVAQVEIGPKEKKQIARFNGKEAVALGIVKQTSANPLDISKKVNKLLPSIRKNLPSGIQMDIAYDSAIFIEQSIKSVFETIIVALLLVMAVIYLFLRKVSATLIPLITIPISLIGSFGIMYLLGFSINTLTLLAMVLAIGLVVDDAIIVLENIYRHIENGMERVKASILGISEIGFAVFAMTITLAFVFTPIAFAEGKTGKLFIEFALTLASAVIVSGFAALTLSPMMCSKILTPHQHKNKLYNKIDYYIQLMINKYQIVLNYCLNNNKKIILISIFSLIFSSLLVFSIKSELAPIEDKGNIVVMGIGPQGASLKYTEKYVSQLENNFKKIPEVKDYFSAVGYPIVSRNISFLTLKPWSERNNNQQTIVENLSHTLFFNVSGLLSFALNPSSLGQDDTSQPIEIVLQTTASYNELKTVLDKIIKQLKYANILENIDTDLNLNTPQLKMTIDRNKVAAIGSSVEDISKIVESYISGRQVTRYKRGNDQYDVIIQVPEKERQRPEQIQNFYTRNKNGDMVALSNLIGLQETVSAAELNHFNKLRSATIIASLGKNVSLNEGINYVNNVIKNIAPSHFQIDYSGSTREFLESQHTIYFIFILALCFVYLILSAQFESFIDPLIILISVPLALMGALLALKVSGGTLNIYSQIGLITLIGLITKHGILIVEFSNQLKRKGQPLHEAIINAATLRFRPILMTTSAMVLGAIPLALSNGAGSESRNDIGWVIVGGLLFGTFFTLFVIPVFYTIIKKEN